jgi:hypothetical protein
VSEDQVKLLEKRTAQYVQLRDEIKRIKEANEEKLAPYKEALETLNTWLLDYLNNTGAKHIATESGTIYRIIRISASLADADVFWKFVLENSAWSLIDRRANVTGVQEYATKEGKLPPGVNLNQYSEAGVRRGK